MPSDQEQEKERKSNPPHPLITEQSEHAQSPPPPKKPRMAAVDTPSDLMSRLDAFLPAMEAANKDLQAEVEDGTIGKRNIEVLDVEEERYIEMNLGLGVLEGKRDGSVSEPSGSGSGESEGEEGDEEDHDVLLRLLNSSKRHGKGPRGKPSIEVVEHSKDTPTPEKQMGHHVGTENK
ncbi:hypothetical protein HOY82DRAFT_581238 [Tuber indicum]|nr:hypothetical protein HOY82DRAFT_581238 [Tuber indicum]